MQVKVKYKDNIITTLTNRGVIGLDTQATYLSDSIIVDTIEAGIETYDATVTADKMRTGCTAYGAQQTKLVGTIPDFNLQTSKIVKKPINLTPQVFYSGMTYTNGYICPDTVIMAGQDSGTAVGTYQAEYRLKPGCKWEDGSIANITVTLTIKEIPHLKFTANTANSTIKCPQEFQYSRDSLNWYTADTDTPITLTNVGDHIYIRNGEVGEKYGNPFGTFTMTGSIAASGNIMSLFDNACLITAIPEGNTNCFEELFYNCTALTTPPELPAITLAYNCYGSMFRGCTNLTVAPALPAMVLVDYCYNFMFRDCSSLTTAPALPATTLAEMCYNGMFWDCIALETVPKLPATTLETMCYGYMFYGCTELIMVENSGEGYDQPMIIPSTGLGNVVGETPTESMFSRCQGRRSTESPDLHGIQKTYYTQNTPVG